MKTGIVRVPGALTATDDIGIVAYAGDVMDEVNVTSTINGETVESVELKTQHAINKELLDWKESVIGEATTPDEYDFSDYYKKSEVDSKLLKKVNTSSIISREIDSHNQSTVNFDNITAADETMIPSMRVIKKVTPRVKGGYDVLGDIDHATNVREYVHNLALIPTVTDNVTFDRNIIAYLIDNAQPIIAADGVDSNSAWMHEDETKIIPSKLVIDKLLYGSNIWDQHSSILDYINNSKATVFKLVYDPEDHTVEPLYINSEEVEGENLDAVISTFVSKLYDCATNNKPFIILAEQFNAPDTVCFANLDSVYNNFIDIKLHFFDRDYTIELDANEGTSKCIYERYGESLYQKELLGACFALNENNGEYALKNPSTGYSLAYYSVLSLFNMIKEGASIPLQFNNYTYYCSSCKSIGTDSYVLRYCDIFDDYSITTGGGYDITLTIYQDGTSTISVDTAHSWEESVISQHVGDATIEVPLANDTTIKDTTVVQQFSWLHNRMFTDIYVGGSPVPKSFYPTSMGMKADLDEVLPNYYIPDSTATMLAKLNQLSGTTVDSDTPYTTVMYDFTGNNAIDSNLDYQAYLDLRKNLVAEVNLLKKKTSSLNIGESVASYSDVVDIENKIWQYIFGNKSESSFPSGQSLRNIIDWLGSPTYNASGNNGTLANWFNNNKEGLIQELEGSNNSVLYLGTEQADLGLLFRGSLNVLNHIVGWYIDGEKGSQDYTEYPVVYDKEGSEDLDFSDSISSIINRQFDSENNESLFTARTVQKIVESITGYSIDNYLTEDYDPIQDRLATLEAFKAAFDSTEFDPENILSDVNAIYDEIDDIKKSKYPLNGIYPFNRFLTASEEDNVRPTETNKSAGTADDIYYSNASGEFVIKDGDLYYTQWGVNLSNPSLNPQYYKDNSDTYLYYDIAYHKFYVVNPIYGAQGEKYLLSKDVHSILVDTSSLNTEDWDHMITTVNIKSGTDDTITPVYGSAMSVDLTALASRSYVDSKISEINDLTPEQLSQITAAINSLSGYATINALNTAVNGMVKSIQLGNTTKTADSNGKIQYTTEELKTILSLSNYLTKSDNIGWNNIVDAPDFITEVTEAMISGKGFTKNKGTLTNVAFNGNQVDTKYINSNGVINLGSIATGIQYTDQNGTSHRKSPEGGTGYVDLGTIVTSIPDPSFKIKINGSNKSFGTVEGTTKGFDLGSGYVTNPVLDTTEYSYISDTETDASSLITLQTLETYWDQNYKPAGGSSSSDIEKVPQNTTGTSGNSVKLDPNTINVWTSAVGQLYIGLKYPGDNPCIYTLRFKTASNFNGFNLCVFANDNNTINSDAKVLCPYDVTWNTNTEYEVSILFDGYSYSIKQVALSQLSYNGNYITIN